MDKIKIIILIVLPFTGIIISFLIEHKLKNKVEQILNQYEKR